MTERPTLGRERFEALKAKMEQRRAQGEEVSDPYANEVFYPIDMDALRERARAEDDSDGTKGKRD